jgi:flagellar biosynthetic protein FliO
MEWMFVKMVLSLAAVLGLMFGLAFLVRKFVLQGKGGTSSSVGIDILGQRTLQPKRSIIVLKVLGKVLVVGMTDHGMHTLAEFDGRDLPDAVGARTRAEGEPSRLTVPERRSFAGHLQHYIQNLVQR